MTKRRAAMEKHGGEGGKNEEALEGALDDRRGVYLG